jgi:hypothetical protein
MELSRLPPGLERTLGGEAFRRRRRLVFPLLTSDPEGFPRAALLTPGEVRATSPTAFAVAVLAGSRTSINLIRRRQATLLYMQRQLAASIRLRAGRGRTSRHDPDRTIFPLTVFRVRIDQPTPGEGAVSLLAGPVFAGADSLSLFSQELFDELGEGSLA